MSVISRELPAPKNWQEFENLAFDVYRRMWKTNDAEMHGRQGQPQAGVDVYGTDRVEQRFTGVQCKGKDGDLNSAVTEAELRGEVAKARTFQPPLEVFVLVTTAPNDHAIQSVARQITGEHAQSGLFEVRVTGWTTFRSYVADYSDVLLKYYQDLAPVDVAAQIAGAAEQQAQGFAQTEKLLRTTMRMIGDRSDNPDAGDQLAARVAEVSKLIGDGAPRAALKALERIEAEEGEAASSLARYRILASRGNAYFALGDEARAISLFHEAFAAHPEYPNARATEAMALTLEGKREEAEPIARAAYEADRSSSRNASIWIDTMEPGTPVAQIEAVLSPDILDNFDIQLHLALQSHENGDPAGHRAHAEAALRIAPEDWRAMSAVAEALAQPLSAFDGLAITHALPDEHRADVERAVVLMKAAWAKLSERDSVFQGRHVAANLIGLLGLLGRDAEAEQILDQALAFEADYAPLAILSARRSGEQGDWKAVARIVDAIPDDELSFDVVLLRTHAAFQLKDGAGAIAWADRLGAMPRPGPDLPDRRELVEALRVRAAILAGADSDQAIKAALEDRPKSIILRSVLFDDMDDEDPLREQLVREIEALAAGELSLRERLHAAETLYVSGHYSMAADLYAPLSGTADSYALRRTLQALHLADRRSEARKLFESLSPELRVSDGYLGLGVGVYERAGLLKPALKLVERALERHDVLRNRLSWIQLLIRLGRPAPMQNWLATVPAEIEGSPIELISLAQLIDRYVGNDERALRIGYRALRAGYGNPRVHLAYALGLIIGGRVSDVVMSVPDTVNPGTGVVLVNDDTGEVLHRIIETAANPIVEREELSPDDALAKRLLGLAVGETIEFPKVGVGPQIYRLAEIQSRYLFAFRRTMRDFPTLFPDNPAFGSFTIDDSKGDERFEEMFALARGRAERGKQLEATYRDHVIPIAMFSRFSGASIFDVWDGFSSNPDIGLKVALGIEGEFEAGRLAAARPIGVVDPLSIYAWVRMGVAPLIRKLSQRLAVVQSTIDALRELAEERESQRGRKMGTFGYDGEHYQLVEMTEEVFERQLAEANAALELAETLPLVPAEAEQALPDKIADLLRDLHPAYHDTLIASLQPQRALITDDFGYRVVAQEAGAQVTWTQCLTKQAQRSKRLSDPEYRQIIGALLDANYRFVQFGANELIGELQDSDWQLNYRLRSYARLLASETLNRASVAQVLAELVLTSWHHARNSSQVAVFPMAYLEVSRELGRESVAREDLVAAHRVAHVLETRALNEFKLPPKLLGTTNLTPVSELARESLEAAGREVARIWGVLRAAGLG
jgi:cellulose synthase operon protein C